MTTLARAATIMLLISVSFRPAGSLLAGGAALPQATSPGPGIDLRGMDRSVAPGDDFFATPTARG